MTTIRIDCTDNELSAAVALTYGWQRRIADRDHPVDHGGMRLPNHFSNDPIEAWTCEGDPLNTGVYCMPPRFATSANAVIPLLAQYQWEVKSMDFSGDRPGHKDVILTIFNIETNVLHKFFVHGDDPGKNFARAACFALLERRGAKVIKP